MPNIRQLMRPLRSAQQSASPAYLYAGMKEDARQSSNVCLPRLDRFKRFEI
jgi:hypothetical protein